MYLLWGPRKSVKDLCGSLLYCCGDISPKGWLVSMLTSTDVYVRQHIVFTASKLSLIVNF